MTRITPNTSSQRHNESSKKGGLSTWQKLALSVLVTIPLLCLIEGIASFLVAHSESRAVPEQPRDEGMREEKHCTHDPELGWMNIPNIRIENIYGEGTTFTTNSQGFRATIDYTSMVPDGMYRVICLGDSFTMGYGVNDDSSFPAQLESLSEKLQVVNMGLGGFGVDQDYLWYKRDGIKLEADLLLFCVIGNDFHRMMNDCFLGQYPKPILELENHDLIIHNVPVPQTAGLAKDYSYVNEFVNRLALAKLLRRKNYTQPEKRSGPLPFAELAEYLFDDLNRISLKRGQDFAIVYLPTTKNMSSDPSPIAQWLEGVAQSKGIAFINVTEELKALEPALLRDLYVRGHFSEWGNRLVAEILRHRLSPLFPRFAEANGSRAEPR
ncbi:MAG: SGNH/GDSL hydrolase family protein [Planctomycetota bacterium]|jgi:hypothetical protein